MGRGRVEAPTRQAGALAAHARAELAEYLSSARSYFTVPLDLSGLPPFQRQVLAATHEIPFGEVRSYRWIAERIGRPQAMRAVGTALGANPIPILIPCHRVVRSDGSLGGYIFGLPVKDQLLALERGMTGLASSTEPRLPGGRSRESRRSRRLTPLQRGDPSFQAEEALIH